eukprot:SAG22_NODE_3227_length_1845_cov_2.298969_1_plen_517_part_00
MPHVYVRKVRLDHEELNLRVYDDRDTVTYTEPEGEAGSQTLSDSSPRYSEQFDRRFSDEMASRQLGPPGVERRDEGPPEGGVDAALGSAFNTTGRSNADVDAGDVPQESSQASQNSLDQDTEEELTGEERLALPHQFRLVGRYTGYGTVKIRAEVENGAATNEELGYTSITGVLSTNLSGKPFITQPCFIRPNDYEFFADVGGEHGGGGEWVCELLDRYPMLFRRTSRAITIQRPGGPQCVYPVYQCITVPAVIPNNSVLVPSEGEAPGPSSWTDEEGESGPEGTPEPEFDFRTFCQVITRLVPYTQLPSRAHKEYFLRLTRDFQLECVERFPQAGGCARASFEEIYEVFQTAVPDISLNEKQQKMLHKVLKNKGYAKRHLGEEDAHQDRARRAEEDHLRDVQKAKETKARQEQRKVAAEEHRVAAEEARLAAEAAAAAAAREEQRRKSREGAAAGPARTTSAEDRFQQEVRRNSTEEAQRKLNEEAILRKQQSDEKKRKAYAESQKEQPSKKRPR